MQSGREGNSYPLPFILPEDLANLVLFLCSDAAAITGQAIAVDGGSGRAISY